MAASSSNLKTPAELVSAQSEAFNDMSEGDLLIRSTLLVPGYPFKKQPPTLFRIRKDKLILASTVWAGELLKQDEGILLRPFGEAAPVVQVEEGCKAIDLLLRFIYKPLEEHPNLNTELFVDVIALLEASAKYKILLLQALCEAVLAYRAPATPAKEALQLYIRAIALKRGELAQAAAKGVIKTKFSDLEEDMLKKLPSEAIIALVKTYEGV